MRSWATHDPVARRAVQAIDRRRVGYVGATAQGLRTCVGSGARPARKSSIGRFVGFALTDKALPRERQQAVLDELLRIALR